MYKYQYFTQNLGIILKKARMMERYILGFQIRKIFPFHLILGSPDFDKYEEILNQAKIELAQQRQFILNQLKDCPLKALEDYYQSSFISIELLNKELAALVQCNSLQRERFFDSSSVKIGEINDSIKNLRSYQLKYQDHLPKISPLWNEVQNSNSVELPPNEKSE
jgi:hypothetical protein